EISIKTSQSRCLFYIQERRYLMHVTDYDGNEYILQATSTNDGDLNGNQSLSATILPTKVNKAFINDLTEMWTITDHDNVEHRIIHVVRRGKGDDMTVDIKAI